MDTTVRFGVLMYFYKNQQICGQSFVSIDKCNILAKSEEELSEKSSFFQWSKILAKIIEQLTTFLIVVSTSAAYLQAEA